MIMQGVTLRSAVQYYFQLRILAHAWSWAGNSIMQFEGRDRRMMTLTDTLGYADQALQHCMERNDLLTRALMCGGGYRAGLALAQASVNATWNGARPL